MSRSTLTRAHIVRAAIALLDSDGLDGLSMRTLGSRLGSAATAVYWHVGSKENLIALAADAVWSEIALPDLATTDWRNAAKLTAQGLRAMLNRHLWLVQAFGSFLMYGQGKARYDDHCLAIYEAAGFTPSEADRASAAIFIFVLGNALGSAAVDALTKKLSRDGGSAEKAIAGSMSEARRIASRFPRLRARLRTRADSYAAAPDESFEFGLEALVDGLKARLGARAQGKPTLRNARFVRTRRR